MRNIREREREKIMPYGLGRGQGHYERDLGRMEYEDSEHSTLNNQEVRRLKSTTAQNVFYLVVGSVLLLLLIVGILGANVFHF